MKRTSFRMTLLNFTSVCLTVVTCLSSWAQTPRTGLPNPQLPSTGFRPNTNVQKPTGYTPAPRPAKPTGYTPSLQPAKPTGYKPISKPSSPGYYTRAGSKTKGGGKKNKAQRPGSRAGIIRETTRQIGGSGKPRRHFRVFPTRKRALDAVKQRGGRQAPVKERGEFHPRNKSGKKVRDGSHYRYGRWAARKPATYKRAPSLRRPNFESSVQSGNICPICGKVNCPYFRR